MDIHIRNSVDNYRFCFRLNALCELEGMKKEDKTGKKSLTITKNYANQIFKTIISERNNYCSVCDYELDDVQDYLNKKSKNFGTWFAEQRKKMNI